MPDRPTDPHEALDRLMTLDRQIEIAEQHRAAIDAKLSDLHARRDADNAIVLRAAKAAGLEDRCILRGPLDSLWVINGGHVGRVHPVPAYDLRDRVACGPPAAEEGHDPEPEGEHSLVPVDTAVS